MLTALVNNIVILSDAVVPNSVIILQLAVEALVVAGVLVGYVDVILANIGNLSDCKGLDVEQVDLVVVAVGDSGSVESLSQTALPSLST